MEVLAEILANVLVQELHEAGIKSAYLSTPRPYIPNKIITKTNGIIRRKDEEHLTDAWVQYNHRSETLEYLPYLKSDDYAIDVYALNILLITICLIAICICYCRIYFRGRRLAF
nr:uncharacterized protein LOC123757025 [Procambarus clarkii]